MTGNLASDLRRVDANVAYETPVEELDGVAIHDPADEGFLWKRVAAADEDEARKPRGTEETNGKTTHEEGGRLALQGTPELDFQ